MEESVVSRPLFTVGVANLAAVSRSNVNSSENKFTLTKHQIQQL